MAFLDGLGRALKAVDCSILSAGDYVFGSLNALQGLDQGLAANVINGARRLRGCDPSGDVQPPPPEFEGGQCPDPYTVTLASTNAPGSPIGGSFVVTGPITSARIGQEPSGNPQAPIRAFAEVTTALDGTQRNAGAITTQADLATVSLDIKKADGSPDNCGSLPGPNPPPININIDLDVEFVDEGDQIVSITVPIEFRPFTVNFNGDVSFPFRFSLGGIEFSGDVSFAPDFSFNVSGPRFPKGGGGQQFEPADPDNERPEAAPEANIVGAVITVTSVSDQAATGIDFVNGPDTFAPRLGSVKFAFSLGAATFWSNDIDIKSRSAFVPCPFSQGADAVTATPVPGVVLTTRPVFGFPIATIGDIKAVLDVI